LAEKDIKNIVDDVDAYVNNMNRFYKDKVYVESAAARKKSSASSEKKTDIINSNEQNTNGRKKGDSEFDLFGNAINVREEWEFAESLGELNSQICNCMKCALGSSRTKFVFGVGDPTAEIVLIGAAPGADADAKGEPFVGRAGQLLNKILEASGFKREEVFICNILKCRPPGNRNPMPEEVEKCRPYLEYQLRLINPKLILLLGKVAAESLLKTKEPLNKLRGKIHDYKGFKVMITFHPAALLRNPNWKRPAWEDMKQFKELYAELTDKKS